MSDGEIPPDRVVDVDGRDPERTPMQWDASPGAGFSLPGGAGPTVEPWLPLAAGADQVNVAVERGDPASMLSLYRRLIWYRKGSAALRWGGYRSLPEVPDSLYAFVREASEERLLVVLNFGGAPVRWPAESDVGDSATVELSTDPAREPGPVRLPDLVIAGDEGLILRLRPEPARGGACLPPPPCNRHPATPRGEPRGGSAALPSTTPGPGPQPRRAAPGWPPAWTLDHGPTAAPAGGSGPCRRSGQERRRAGP
jgi:Domain of unknown function (DUF3459)